MPRIRKCRRSLRDEAAGLLFHWRRPTASFSRTGVAIVIATILFGVMSSLLHVSGKTSRTVGRETAHFVVLPPTSDEGREWRDWARRNSPFPDRWEVKVDGTVQRHLALFESELTERAKYQPLLRPMTAQPREFPLPELFDPAAPPLPALGAAAAPDAPRPPRESVVVTEAEGALATRWGDLQWPLGALLAELGAERAPANPLELLGLQRRFLVAAEASGAVLFCQSLDEVESGLDAVLASRLRRHQLAPAKEGAPLASGTVRVSVRALPAGEEEAP